MFNSAFITPCFILVFFFLKNFFCLFGLRVEILSLVERKGYLCGGANCKNRIPHGGKTQEKHYTMCSVQLWKSRKNFRIHFPVLCLRLTRQKTSLLYVLTETHCKFDDTMVYCRSKLRVQLCHVYSLQSLHVCPEACFPLLPLNSRLTCLYSVFSA